MAAGDASQIHDVETDHEYDGIREFDNPLPAWWLWTFVLAFIFGVIYWIGTQSMSYQRSGEQYLSHKAEMAAYQQAMAAKSVNEEELVAIAQDPAAVAAGREVYMTNCKSCHLEHGEGQIGANLTDAYWIHGSSPKEIWSTITFGVPEKGMPTWGPVLGDKKVRELYAFIASIKDTNVTGKAPQGVDASGAPPAQ